MRIALAFLLAPTVALAAAKPHGRFHFLTPELVKRLSPEAQTAAKNLVRLGSKTNRGDERPQGTGFVVSRSGDRALVLTNHHVHNQIEGFTDGDHGLATFLGGKTLRVTGVVTKSKAPDYALLEVKLPRGAKKVEPLTLDADGMKKNQPVFKVSALGNIDEVASARDKKITKRIAVTSRNRQSLDEFYQGVPLSTIETGSVGSTFKTKGVYGKTKVLAFNTSIRVVPGNSGSPIVSKETGKVVGLLWGESGKSYADGIGQAFSSKDILSDLKKQLGNGTIDKRHMVSVEKLVFPDR